MKTTIKTTETRVTVAYLIENAPNKVETENFILTGRHTKKEVTDFFKESTFYDAQGHVKKPCILEIKYQKVAYTFDTATLTEFCLNEVEKTVDID